MRCFSFRLCSNVEVCIINSSVRPVVVSVHEKPYGKVSNGCRGKSDSEVVVYFKYLLISQCCLLFTKKNLSLIHQIEVKTKKVF